MRRKINGIVPIPYYPQGTFVVLKIYPCCANQPLDPNGALTKLRLISSAKEAMVLEVGYCESIEMCDFLLYTRADLWKELLNQFLLFVNMMTSSKGFFQGYWPFVRGVHRSPVNSPHKGQWRGALMFSLICAWINDWVNNREAGDLRLHRAQYELTVIKLLHFQNSWISCYLPHT